MDKNESWWGVKSNRALSHELWYSLEGVFFTRNAQSTHICCRHCLLWMSNHSNVYIAERNENKGSLFSWIPSQPSTCSSWKEPSPGSYISYTDFVKVQFTISWENGRKMLYLQMSSLTGRYSSAPQCSTNRMQGQQYESENSLYLEAEGMLFPWGKKQGTRIRCRKGWCHVRAFLWPLGFSFYILRSW